MIFMLQVKQLSALKTGHFPSKSFNSHLKIPSNIPKKVNLFSVWSIIENGGGGCKYGLHRPLYNHTLSWPKCVNSTKYISWWSD